MSSVGKVKKKKGRKVLPKNAAKTGTEHAEEEADRPLGETDKVMSGSFISVREATQSDKADNVENMEQSDFKEDDSSDNAVYSRPASGKASRQSTVPRPLSAVSTNTLSPPHPMSRPSSGHSQMVASGSPISQRSHSVNSVVPVDSPEGSQVSLRSREAWIEGTEQAPNADMSRPISAISGKSVNTPVTNLDKAVVKSSGKDNQGLCKLGPAEMDASHAYVPYMYARDCISKIVEDMKNMKQGHIHIVHDIENNYRAIEDETQAQFNAFVLGLRQQYSGKVKTFRQVIEVHRIELAQKQQHWDDALMSLSGRNKQLLQDKKRLLIQNKVEFDRLEKEKKEHYGTLTAKVDETNIILAKSRKEYEEKLDEERKENERLHQRIEELEISESVAMATAASSVTASRPQRPDSAISKDSRQYAGAAPTVIVSDLSEEDRQRLAKQQRRIAGEREQMSAERQEIEIQRLGFTEERRRFQEERVVLQGDLNSARKSREEWRVRYEALHGQLGDVSDLKAQYEALQAVFNVVASLAVVSTPEERKKVEDKIIKTEADRQLMLEEKHVMDQDIKKWEVAFKAKHGREPTKDDRPDSITELHTSLNEASTMAENLNMQVVALESLKEGQVPQPPTIVPKPIDIKEPEVISVEVKVPDPEVQAELESSQSEVVKLRSEQDRLREELANLEAQVSRVELEHLDLRAEIARLEALNKALDTELAAFKLAGAPGLSQKGIDEAELQKALGERDKEHERQQRDMQHEFENQLRQKEQEKREVERDIKKLLKQHAKQQKSQDNERIKHLLHAVVTQAKEVNGEVNVAAEKVSDRLTKAQDETLPDQDKLTEAKAHYKKWESGFTEKHGQPPSPQERDADKNGKKLYEDYSSAEKGSEQRELLVTALQMIHTGVVPEKLQPKATAVTNKEVEKLEQKLSDLEDKIVELEDKLADSVSSNSKLQSKNNDLEEDIEELRNELAEARHHLDAGMGSAGPITVATTGEMMELTALKNRIKDLEQTLWDKEKAMKDKDLAHLEELKVKERERKEMERDIKKMIKQMDKFKKEKGIGAAPLSADQDKAALEEQVESLEDQVSLLEDKVTELEQDKIRLEQDNHELEEKLRDARGSVGFTGAVVSSDDDVQDLSRQISALQRQVDEAEASLQKEKSAHDDTKEELESAKKQLAADEEEMESAMNEAQAKLDGNTAKMQADIDNLTRKLAEAEARLEDLEKERMKNVPVDTVKEISDLKAKQAVAAKEKDSAVADNAKLKAEIKQLQAQIASLEKASKSQKANNSDSEVKLKQLRQEKDKEIKTIQAAADKKEQERAKQEQKKITALEKKIRELEVAAAGATTGRASTAKPDVKGGDKALQERLQQAKQENGELQRRIKQLELESKEARSKSGAGASEADKNQKKQEKILKELQKKLDMELAKNEKNEKNLKQKEDQLKNANKDISAKEEEIKKLKAELAALGVAAQEGAEAATKLKDLEKEVKTLKKDNKELADNFNSERVLRKKYYNMVEDMKGKIRVYCRVRPMSKSELDRGNTSVCNSPDEYTIQVGSARGQKDFQFDSIFMPESTQEKVFEDTNNLVQSAVDGFNVCIFAYGQTGSGKTFTIIGDREQNFPGIAPRAFNRIYELLDENKQKFSYKVSCYMLELYNDRLLDLFTKGGGNEDKMEIKKDKKGMVFVQGSEIKFAKSAKELYALFEEGSKIRHVASTNMNAESSRSHLVIGIIIETTNKATGQVMKGKLSLVDLAGSERAAKTGATAEQLKEAMSINKSLSALGDVISALSSEQSFIPYRNNKLTMLMQDSLGGNAKTLMFVNVSPADYNSDETVVSLTYASRVKLITNDASKNSDNKEIARLKNVIAKLKAGEAVQEEDAQS